MSRFRSCRRDRSGFAGRHVPGWCVGLLAVLLWLGFAGAGVRGQGQGRGSKFYPDSNDTAEKWLRTAAVHARARQWSEAIQFYQRVIDQYGDKVAQLPKGEAGTDPSDDFGPIRPRPETYYRP